MAPIEAAPRWWLASLLFLTSIFTTTTLGAVWYLWSRTDQTTDLQLWIGTRTIERVWNDPELLASSLSFSLPVLLILLVHELGHYLSCRAHQLPATLPYFLPIPLGLGTFGAFIRIKSPIRSKRELLDVGVSGPIAGFVALLPFLFIGLARSEIVPLDPSGVSGAALLVPGSSLLMTLGARLISGPVPAGHILMLHPFAMAAWVGMLATALNLLPLGQLDGGHVLYAATGRWQRRLALPIWSLLAVAGLLSWKGWFLFFALTFFFGIKHPPVRDETEPLNPARRWLAVFGLVIFILCLTLNPVTLVPV